MQTCAVEREAHVDGDDVAAADKVLEIAEVLCAHSFNLWLLVAVVVGQLDAEALHIEPLQSGCGAVAQCDL